MTSERDPATSYDIREVVGKGAFGSAHLAVHRETGKQYVLKRIRLARQSNWQRNSTLQEIKLVSLLHHPFIVPYIESWTHHGHTVNIVYGYCERGDLGTLLQKQKDKHFTEDQLKLWLAELLLGLDYMHSQGVLHRDIKSSNIFLTAGGDVQIGDFGLATFRGTDDDVKHDQSMVGTPHYMSPELLSHQKYSYKTDVWSLGCVLYELTALKPAFNAFNLSGLVHKIRKGAIPPLPASYSEDWGKLIKKMLRKDESSRPGVKQLLSEPCLREAVSEALQRGSTIMPEVHISAPEALALSETSSLTSPLELRTPLEDSTPSDAISKRRILDDMLSEDRSPCNVNLAQEFRPDPHTPPNHCDQAFLQPLFEDFHIDDIRQSESPLPAPTATQKQARRKDATSRNSCSTALQRNTATPTSRDVPADSDARASKTDGKPAKKPSGSNPPPWRPAASGARNAGSVNKQSRKAPLRSSRTKAEKPCTPTQQDAITPDAIKASTASRQRDIKQKQPPQDTSPYHDVANGDKNETCEMQMRDTLSPVPVNVHELSASGLATPVSDNCLTPVTSEALILAIQGAMQEPQSEYVFDNLMYDERRRTNEEALRTPGYQNMISVADYAQQVSREVSDCAKQVKATDGEGSPTLKVNTWMFSNYQSAATSPQQSPKLQSRNPTKSLELGSLTAEDLASLDSQEITTPKFNSKTDKVEVFARPDSTDCGSRLKNMQCAPSMASPKEEETPSNQTSPLGSWLKANAASDSDAQHGSNHHLLSGTKPAAAKCLEAFTAPVPHNDLENIVKLTMQLAQRGRWQEIASVLSSPCLQPLACEKRNEWLATTFTVGDTVEMKGTTALKGVVKYYGPCHWDFEDYVGLELEHPGGGTNGTVDGIQYFSTRPNHGTFIKVSCITPKRHQKGRR